MANQSFPEGTRFFSEKGMFMAMIGGPMSGGALVTFTSGEAGTITIDDFFKIDPSVELSEVEFRKHVGGDTLQKWFAAEPNAVTAFLADREAMGEYAELGMDRSFIESLSPAERAGMLETHRKISAEREEEGPWISTEDWNEVMEGRPPE